MPANFGETLSPKELEDLVEYLIESTTAAKAAARSSKGG